MAESTASAPTASLRRCLATLQGVLTEARDFKVPFDHFDAHVVSHPDFWSCSSAGHDPALAQFLRDAVRRAVGLPARLDLTMFEIRGAGFWHGLGSVKARVPGKLRRKSLYYFYYARSGLGLVGLGDTGHGGDVDHMLRFHAVVLPDPVWPFPAPAQA